MKTFTALTLLVLLTGCPHKLPVHPPPQYSEDGMPSDTFYEDLATLTSEMAGAGEIPSDPEEARQAAYSYLEERNIRIIPKAEGYERWDKFTTTFPRSIFVSKNWDSMSVSAQAEVLWHEIVHVRQYDRHTPLGMGALYVLAEGRWALEVQAYRESFRVQRLFGLSEEQISERLRPRAEQLYTEYELRTMPREYAVEMAIEIWSRDLQVVGKVSDGSSEDHEPDGCGETPSECSA